MFDGILCDQEGKINYISANHARLLKYSHNGISIQKRIFAFFEKSMVFDIMQQWVMLEKSPAVKIATNLRTMDNTTLPVNISITKQEDSNYLVKIIPMQDNNNIPNLKLSLINSIQMWLLIIRANFLLATFVPLIFGIVWSLHYVAISALKPGLLIALIIGITCCHIAANTFNDYFDWVSGADKANTDFIMSISGGSRAMEFGMITEQKLFMVATFSLLIAASCALYLSIIKGPVIIILSFIGAFAIYFYTAPPIRLVAKYGLGEVFIFLCFGPIFIAGIIYVLTTNINWESFFIGIPIGLLTTSILLINEYPDLAADTKAKKTNLAVVLGPKLLPFGVALLIIFSYLVTIIAVVVQVLPKCFLLSMFTLPFAIYEIINICKIKQNRQCIKKACICNIQLYALFGLSFIVAGIINLFNLDLI